MGTTPYIFNQLVQWVPRDRFDRLVKHYQGNAYVKGYSCWNHLLVLLWTQLTSRHSLRDIETSLRAHADKLYRMGIGRHVSRNNIANASARRDVAIYRGIAMEMMRIASLAVPSDSVLKDIAAKFSICGFLAIDSSTVSLDLGRHPWCTPQKGFGGVKMHTMYDILRQVPHMCLITGREERDQTFMEDYPYEARCFYVLDKAYVKTRGLAAINGAEGFFVVRRKRNMVYEVVGDNGTADDGLVLADRTIRFTSRWASAGYPDDLRMVTCYIDGKNEAMQFMTNNFDVPAKTVAMLYKYRWQIELFFKWVKQHLRIISFYGTSANAVMMQIYTALTAFCLLALAGRAVGYKGSLYDFSNLVSVSLTERVPLKELVCRYETVKKNVGDDEPAWLSLFDY